VSLCIKLGTSRWASARTVEALVEAHTDIYIYLYIYMYIYIHIYIHIYIYRPTESPYYCPVIYIYL